MKQAVRRGKAVRSTVSRKGSRLQSVKPRAFSIIELLVAAAILAVILGIIFSITQMISQSWGKSTAKIEAFQGARTAFDSMSRQISQATLNTYYDYFDSGNATRASYGTNTSSFSPVRYGRYSDLHFLSGKSLVNKQVGHAIFFQAPLGYTDDTVNFGGMDTLLSGCGYFVAYDQDNSVPSFLGSLPNKPAVRHRFRLMQYLQPSQNLKVYDPAATDPKAWFQTPLSGTNAPLSILAENIVAFAILPKLSKLDAADASSKGTTADLAPLFEYDTRTATTGSATAHQLPPVVELVMVAIDENSAQRFCTASSMPDFGVGGLNTLFQKASDLETDLEKLTAALTAAHVPYRVFRTEVALRGAKWSSQ